MHARNEKPDISWRVSLWFTLKIYWVKEWTAVTWYHTVGNGDGFSWYSPAALREMAGTAEPGGKQSPEEDHMHIWKSTQLKYSFLQTILQHNVESWNTFITICAAGRRRQNGDLYEEVKEYFVDKELCREIEKTGNYMKTKEKAWCQLETPIRLSCEYSTVNARFYSFAEP